VVFVMASAKPVGEGVVSVGVGVLRDGMGACVGGGAYSSSRWSP